MRDIRVAILVVAMMVLPFTVARADPGPPPPQGVTSPVTPLPGAGPIVNGPPAVTEVPQTRPPAGQLRHLAGKERWLRRHIWRLRMRRRHYRALGMPAHAHRVHERIIRLGWRLRRVEAAKRVLQSGRVRP